MSRRVSMPIPVRWRDRVREAGAWMTHGPGPWPHILSAALILGLVGVWVAVVTRLPDVVLYWVTNVCWAALATGFAVWGGNGVVIAFLRWRHLGEPIFTSPWAWRWPWNTLHAVSWLAVMSVDLNVTIIRLSNDVGRSDSPLILTVRLVAASLVWLTLIRWLRTRWADVDVPSAKQEAIR